MALSLSDLVSSYSAVRSKSLTRPMPSQRGHMPPRRLKVAFSRLVLPPCSTVIEPLAVTDGHVEGVGVGRTDLRVAEPAEEDPQHGVGVGDRAHGGAGVGPQPLLVDEDRRRQPLEDVDVGPGHGRHEALHERAVGLVDQPLRLRRDGAEHQRALARAGHAGEDRQPALREVDAHVPEVVDPGAVHADQVVVVGGVALRGRGLPRRGLAHRVSIIGARAGGAGGGSALGGRRRGPRLIGHRPDPAGDARGGRPTRIPGRSGVASGRSVDLLDADHVARRVADGAVP